MNELPKSARKRDEQKQRAAAAKTVDALVAPQEQAAQAHAVLSRLQLRTAAAEARLNQAAQLLEANEQLVLATLRAQGEAEISAHALDEVARSAELAAITLASQSKSEFLSRVSHELRTPLNAILGFGQLMLADDNTLGYLDHVQRERLEAIRLAGQQLLSLTNDILDLASIEDGRVHIEMESVDAAALINTSMMLLQPAALERSVSMRNESQAGGRDLVMADARALGQVLLNLMSNAVKYNREGGWVSVRTEAREAVVIVVEDNGVGMTDVQQADLFQPFNRLGAESGAVPGCGLGLVISKALVELMGGKLVVHSAPGIGTRMEVHLSRPLAEDSTHAGSPDAVLSLGSAVIAVPRTILYVEDNPVNALLLKQLIATEPAWSLSAAATGADGIELAKTLRPSLILLDMHLPDMSGLQVLRALQRQQLLPPKGCVCLSADAMPDQVRIALDAGFSQYWTKPLELSATMHKLRELLAADS